MPYQDFSPRKVGSRGPESAQVLVVGEAPGEQEDALLRPFVGSAGYELDRQLSEAKFIASATRYTNAIRYRPWNNDVDLAFCSSEKAALAAGAKFINGKWAKPVAQEGLVDLQAEIASIKPKLIIAVGGTALWATTGKNGIENWRSSTLPCLWDPSIPVVPTYHPSAILHQWENRYLAIHDLKRANRVLNFGPAKQPDWNFRVRPNFETVMECLDQAEAAGELAVDIETKKLHIACVAIAWNRLDCICIPFFRANGQPYWSELEELEIVMRLRRMLAQHKVIGQNFHYDAQYFTRRMLVIPSCSFDTLLAQHVLFPGTPKSLAHNSSLYCDYHIFWKDDGKEWDPRIHPEEQLWTYNCTDAVKTFEVKEEQQKLLEKYNMQPQMDYMMSKWPHILITMLRGVRIDKERKLKLADELREAIAERRQWLNTVTGWDFNPKSPVQVKTFFVDMLGVKPKKGKKTKGVSFDKKNLNAIGDQHILLWPIINVMNEVRSLGVFLSTFAEAELDEDGRMRCSYNLGGTETFRLSSSENAFYTGTNLQNIPSGNRSTTMKMPNMKEMFIPDEGMEIAEIDLAGADAQVVAWDSGEERLKNIFKEGKKIHVENGRVMYGEKLMGPDGKAEPYYTRVKQGCHLTNYCGKAGTMASTLNLKRSECEEFQEKWLRLNPRIPKWWAEIQHELNTTRSVKNIFGFRRVYFDRPENLLAQGVAWKPQSTIAIVANIIWERLASEPRLEVEVLMQVHDSLVFQYPIAQREEILRRVRELVKVIIPYKEPLIIPLGLKCSTKSWGHMEDQPWPKAETAIAA